MAGGIALAVFGFLAYLALLAGLVFFVTACVVGSLKALGGLPVRELASRRVAAPVPAPPAPPGSWYANH